MEICFLGSIGHIMTDAGLKGLFSVVHVYAKNTVPHMLSGKVIARAIRAHTLVELTLPGLWIYHARFVLPGANFINKVRTIYLKLCVRCFLRSAYVSFIKTS